MSVLALVFIQPRSSCVVGRVIPREDVSYHRIFAVRRHANVVQRAASVRQPEIIHDLPGGDLDHADAALTCSALARPW